MCNSIRGIAYFSSSFAGIFDVQCILAGRILEHASGPLKNKYLKPLIAGKIVDSFATSEPETSSDLSLHALKTIGEESRNEIVDSGIKRWKTNAPVAKFVVFLCRVGDQTRMLLVDLDSEGVTVEKNQTKK